MPAPNYDAHHDVTPTPDGLLAQVEAMTARLRDTPSQLAVLLNACDALPKPRDVVLESAVTGLQRQMSELSSVLDDEVAEERGRAFAEHMSVATFVPAGGGRGF